MAATCSLRVRAHEKADSVSIRIREIDVQHVFLAVLKFVLQIAIILIFNKFVNFVSNNNNAEWH